MNTSVSTYAKTPTIWYQNEQVHSQKEAKSNLPSRPENFFRC